MVPDATSPKHSIINTLRKEMPECPQVKILRIDGNLFFAAVPHVSSALRQVRKGPEKWLIVLANGIHHVDLDGAAWFAQEARYWRERKKGGIVVVRLKNIAREIIRDGGYLHEIGEENLFESKTEAIAWVYAQLDRSVCATCTKRIFMECTKPESPQN